MEAMEEAPELLGGLPWQDKKHFMIKWKQDLLADEYGLEYIEFYFSVCLLVLDWNGVSLLRGL